ncbi:MAG: hypothetical protein ACYDC1_15640 [Limisphaerales bacterium]
MTTSPGSWEVYDLSTDPAETINLADQRRDLIRAAEALLRREVAVNPVFPMIIPGVNDPPSRLEASPK